MYKNKSKIEFTNLMTTDIAHIPTNILIYINSTLTKPMYHKQSFTCTYEMFYCLNSYYNT